MSDLQLIYNKETGCWERKPEPYLTLEIATQADFEELKAAVEFYKNRDKYVEQKHGWWIARIDNDTPMHECSECGSRVVKGLYEYENPNLFCYHCGAKMDLKP